MSSRYLIQSPGEALDYSNDWTDWLGAGDSIASRVWSILPDASPSHLSNETTAAVTVGAGLTRGDVYRLTEQVTTAAGIVGEQITTIRCEVR